MGKHRSSSSERWNIARVLTLIGALLTLVGYAFTLVNSALNAEFMGILLSILCIVLGLLVLIQVRIVKSNKFDIPFNWWVLLILVIVQAIVVGTSIPGFYSTADLGGLISLGLVLEVIAVILLLINAL